MHIYNQVYLISLRQVAWVTIPIQFQIQFSYQYNYTAHYGIILLKYIGHSL